MKRLFGVLAILTLLISVQTVRADIADLTINTGCGVSGVTSYTSALKMPVGMYDVYVRSGKPGEHFGASAYARMNSQLSRCQALGTANVVSDSWTRLSTAEVTRSDEELVLQLQSDSLSARPDANRPAFLLLSHTKPVCAPAQECTVTVDGNTGYIRPFGSAPNQNSMLMVRAVDPSSDVLTRVRYYVDTRLVYVRDELQQFDQRFVEYGGQVLTRVAEYKSGQQIVFQEKVPDGYVDTSFWHYLYRMQQRADGLLRAFLLILLVVVIILPLRLAFLYFKHRKQWKIAHGLLHESWEKEILTPAGQKRLRVRALVERVTHVLVKYLGVSAALLLMVWAIVNHGLLVTKINGTSMINTYESGQMAFVNRLPVTLAKVNRLQFVPQRGAVIIAKPKYGLLDQSIVVDGAEQTVIKRVVGLPGERVVIDNGLLTIYNAEHPAGFRPDEGKKWSETMIDDTSKGHIDIKLSASEIFISGDNRPDSIDSRFNGAIATEQIVGEVFWVQ